MIEQPAALVELRDVRKRYRRRGPWVLDGVDLHIARGSITVISGANGSGKSTLLRTMLGLSTASSGTVIRSAASMAFAPERLSATLRMTATSYLHHVARIRGIDRVVAGSRITTFARQFGVQPGVDVPIHTLSKGNSQKVAIIQALLAPVELVVLDEPHTGLDAASRSALDELLVERAAGGAAVVLTSHRGDVASAARYDLAGGALTIGSASDAGSGSATRIVVAPRSRLHGPASFDDVHDVEVIETLAGGEVVLVVDVANSDQFLAGVLRDGWSVVSVRQAGRG